MPGGVTILWNKGLDSFINVVRLAVDWCIGVQFKHNGREFIILNVCTPYECNQKIDEYVNRLAFIYSFIQSCTSYLCICHWGYECRYY